MAIWETVPSDFLNSNWNGQLNNSKHQDPFSRTAHCYTGYVVAWSHLWDKTYMPIGVHHSYRTQAILPPNSHDLFYRWANWYKNSRHEKQDMTKGRLNFHWEVRSMDSLDQSIVEEKAVASFYKLPDVYIYSRIDNTYCTFFGSTVDTLLPAHILRF